MTRGAIRRPRRAWRTSRTRRCGARARSPRSVVLVPVGSVEPHGPHLPLATDTTHQRGVRRRAAAALGGAGRRARSSRPTVPYGVTDYARGLRGRDRRFRRGAHRACLRAVVERLLADGLRPRLPREQPPRAGARRGGARGHRRAARGRRRRSRARSRAGGRARSPTSSSAATATRARYETSLVLAAGAAACAPERADLPRGRAEPVGGDRGRARRRSRAWGSTARTPARRPMRPSRRARGCYERLVEMIVGEVTEALQCA